MPDLTDLQPFWSAMYAELPQSCRWTAARRRKWLAMVEKGIDLVIEIDPDANMRLKPEVKARLLAQKATP